MAQCFVSNSDSSDFPIENLPYGVFSKGDSPRVGVRIGDFVLDCAILEHEGVLDLNGASPLFNQPTLNAFAATPKALQRSVRAQLQTLLAVDNDTLQGNAQLLSRALLPVAEVAMHLPFAIGGYTDFYAGIHHATNVGALFRGRENALMPNWKHLPVAYNGRASTVYVSGTAVKRPSGLVKKPDEDVPRFKPSARLDYELEMGIFVAAGNPDASPIPVDNALEHIFGLVILNDWSARDIQAFEYVPLGPFLAKSFATSISPWVVPIEAIIPFMAPMAAQDPVPADYLQQADRQIPDIKLRVEIQPKGADERTVLGDTNYKELYWNMEQMLAHHTINHCVMQTGDLYGTGTISGEARSAFGSLLEISENGKLAITLNGGGERTFIEDGDTIIMSGYCEGNGVRIGFGEVRGTVLPADA